MIRRKIRHHGISLSLRAGSFPSSQLFSGSSSCGYRSKRSFCFATTSHASWNSAAASKKSRESTEGVSCQSSLSSLYLLTRTPANIGPYLPSFSHTLNFKNPCSNETAGRFAGSGAGACVVGVDAGAVLFFIVVLRLASNRSGCRGDPLAPTRYLAWANRPGTSIRTRRINKRQ